MPARCPYARHDTLYEIYFIFPLTPTRLLITLSSFWCDERVFMNRLVALLLLASCLFAQSERGSINGLVTDPSGAAVAAAEIVAVHTATNSTARTSASS